MSIVELLLIAVGLAMDAFAVAIGKGLSLVNVRPKQAVIVGLWFGGFQALMPILGYYVGISFAGFVEGIDHWIAFGLLALIGVNMVRESREHTGCELNDSDFSILIMFPLAIATSIDALAVGVSLAFLNESIWGAATTIGVVTFAISAAGLYVGNLFGSRHKAKAEITGGVVLILIGIKILVEHLLC